MRTGLTTSFLCLLVACGGSTKSEDTTASGKKATEESSLPVPAATASSYLNAMPSDYNVALYVSASSLVESALWTRYGGKITEALAKEQDFVKTAEKCGVDFTKQVDWLLMAGSSVKEDFTVVVKGFDAKQVECAVRANAGVVETSGDISKITVEGKDIYVGWLAADVLITGPKGEGSDVWLKERLARQGTGKWSKEDDAMTMWISMVPDASMAPAFQMLASGAPQRIRGDMRVTTALDARFEFVMADSQGAANAAQNLNAAFDSVKSAPPFGEFSDAVSITAVGPSTVIKLSMDPPKFEKFLTTVDEQILPMLNML